MKGSKLWILLIPVLILAGLRVRGQTGDRQTIVQFLPTASAATTVPASTVPPALELPYVIGEAGLIVERMVCYEGDFWEDGNDMPAVDAMALVVYNPGTSGIRRAQIVAMQGNRQLCFEITFLPPGSRVLVLERFRKPYSREPLTRCRCETVEKMAWEEPASVRVTPVGACRLLVENTGSDLQAVTIRYKRYDRESEMFLGGITYQLTLEPLLSGGQMEVSPQRYTESGSRIVLVETQTNKE